MRSELKTLLPVDIRWLVSLGRHEGSSQELEDEQRN